MSHDKHVNVQDAFLNHIRKNRTQLTVFLVNGVKLQGTITWFDVNTILLRRDGHSQLIYKHAISTLMPHGHVQIFESYQVASGEESSSNNNMEDNVGLEEDEDENYEEEEELDDEDDEEEEYEEDENEKK
jgi:host factor-I protein